LRTSSNAYPPKHTDIGNIRIIAFGPGYGESLLLYLPGFGWGVIDSCLCKTAGENINPALEYLKSESVNQLEFLVLTHPHEDHYLGMEQIIEHYMGKIKRIAYYSGDGLREYRAYLEKQYFLNNGVLLEKLGKILGKVEIAKGKGSQVIRIAERTEIIRRGNFGANDVEMLALSPSEESVRRYVEILFRAIPKLNGDKLKELSGSQHNLLAAAIWISFNKTRIILGSDVEQGDSNGLTGWSKIISSIDGPDLSAHFVKVSHHGSSNAFHRNAWEKHAANNFPIAIITPYVKLEIPLPTEDNIEQIAKYSHPVVVTSKHHLSHAKKIYARSVLKHTQMMGMRKLKIISEDQEISSWVSVSISSLNGSVVDCVAGSSAYWANHNAAVFC